MKIKTLAICAFMTLAVSSAFAGRTTVTLRQDSMMSMDDQDYSGWKETYFKMKATPAGATSSEKMMMMAPQFRDTLDAMVFKKLVKMASEEYSRPYRPFDTADIIISDDAYWLFVEKKLNTYRRELIREYDARKMSNDRMMGKAPMAPSM